jgi:axial budding pattern protein 2
MTDVLLFILAFLTAATLNLANATTGTAVTVLQSLNLQLPLVARIGQPYSWTISPLTFGNTSGGPLNYTTSALPAWLAFDPNTQTFRGTPSAQDIGYPEITLIAHAGESFASSKTTICVTRDPAPILKLPLEQQFVPNSRSLSSVYFLRNNSALNTSHPSLRIPRKWSFSIGMDSNMFLAAPKMFYELRLANGSAIPDYLNFNSRTVTLDGVIPPGDKITQPSVISCVLHASDQEGYTASLLPFDLVIADHELSLSQAVKSFPTINITIESPFVASLSSAVDYTGVLVDGDPIQPSNISSLDIDVSDYPWLRYDKASRTLIGTPGADVTGTTPLLPVTLTTTFNQNLTTTVSLNLVESYFALPVLPSLHVSQGEQIEASLTPWFSKSNSHPGYDGTSLIASYEPASAADFLRFDEFSANVTGIVPSGFHSASDHITLSFTAYSNISHTTSHTSLTIYVPDSENTQSLAPSQADGLTEVAHKKLVLALGLSFGLIGGLCVLAGIFAILRRWAKVEDTAIIGEEGRRALSEKDQRWYGLNMSPDGKRVEKGGAAAVSKPPPPERPRGPRPQYGGLGLRRVNERGQETTDSQEYLVGQAVMRKSDFLARIKETVRQVSNKYSRKQDTNISRPAIGKPILVSSTRAPANRPEVVVHSSPSNPFEDSLAPSRPGSTFLSSPSGSTAEQSIPRRRADFAPPRNPAQVHFKDGLPIRHPSTGSVGYVVQ